MCEDEKIGTGRVRGRINAGIEEVTKIYMYIQFIVNPHTVEKYYSVGCSYFRLKERIVVCGAAPLRPSSYIWTKENVLWFY